MYLGDHDSDKRQEVKNRREKYYSELVNDFEQSPARLLYRDCSGHACSNRRKQLLDIFCPTGEYFSRLWAQKAYIDVLDLTDLKKIPYQNDSDLLEAHAVHNLENGDERMDGMPVQMVVEPAIIAWGNEQGENYDARKIWAKAVVWMSSGGPEQPQGGAPWYSRFRRIRNRTRKNLLQEQRVRGRPEQSNLDQIV